MARLSMIDTGATKIKTSSSYYEADIFSKDGAINPSGTNYPANKQCIDIGAYALSYEMGKNIDTSDNIAGNVTRLGVGGAKVIPITLSATFYRTRIEEDSEDTGGVHYTAKNCNATTYLSAWARKASICMLMWLPNEEDLANNSKLSYGQEKDFFTSQLKCLYDAIWDKNLGNANMGWSDNAYGTYHYHFDSFFTDGSSYNPCAIPIILENVTVKEDASSNTIDVEVTGYVLNNEEESN